MFFMAPDGVHHLEGTFTSATREFRLYFYDSFTRPVDARQFHARIGNHRLEAAPNGAYLVGRVTGALGDAPEVTAFVRFAPHRREDRFDFIFVPELRAQE